MNSNKDLIINIMGKFCRFLEIVFVVLFGKQCLAVAGREIVKLVSFYDKSGGVILMLLVTKRKKGDEN
ncbi:hypothetical protein DRF59_11160 [Chryseobacterium flavum]|uniref:Uncharacterized protein n=1 Tax=Chryseobacterium flavum TaxID=415851 RepID=A0A3D9CMH6_9FLAO|nr:hypothetical protein [Chryseobacterium flavum]REC66859.1 hypothetical protein DRF59_11160 [Chryseobacterium flavum]